MNHSRIVATKSRNEYPQSAKINRRLLSIGIKTTSGKHVDTFSQRKLVLEIWRAQLKSSRKPLTILILIQLKWKPKCECSIEANWSHHQ